MFKFIQKFFTRCKEKPPVCKDIDKIFTRGQFKAVTLGQPIDADDDTEIDVLFRNGEIGYSIRAEVWKNAKGQTLAGWRVHNAEAGKRTAQIDGPGLGEFPDHPAGRHNVTAYGDHDALYL